MNESVNKELEGHQLQCGACTTPLYINPCNLFMHLDLLHFLLLSACCPHSLQDFHSSFLPVSHVASGCLPLRGLAGLDRVPGLPSPAATTPGTSGMLHRWLWQFYSVIVFMGRVGSLSNYMLSYLWQAKLENHLYWKCFKKCFSPVSSLFLFHTGPSILKHSFKLQTSLCYVLVHLVTGCTNSAIAFWNIPK